MSTRWELIRAVEARLADEQGTLVKEGAQLRVALCYPSPYHVGMSSLGFQTIYREIHAHPEATAERAFLPDDVEAFRASGTALFTCETQRPVGGHDLLAFSVAYEPEITGLFEMLRLSGLPVLREERSGRHPLVVAGGPLTFSNPVPLEPFVDLIVMGEADDAIHELLQLALEAKDRDALLQALVDRPGFHVPGAGRPLPKVGKADDGRLPARTQILTPHTELRSMFLIEPERGCSRGCTYCVMRRTTNGGMRIVQPERVLELLPPHAKRVGLVGAAVTDHPRLPELLRAIVEGGREVSVSSLRADRLTDEIVAALKAGGARNLTTAADGASERLRIALDRKTHERHLVAAAELVRRHALSHLKLYLMVGLPGETDDDLDELVRLGGELSKIVPIDFGCAPFVAKRNTPMDGAPFAGLREVERKLDRLRAGLRGRAEIRSISAKWAWVEYMLAQAGVEAGLAAHDAWLAGGSFADFKRAFAQRGVQPGLAARAPDGRRELPQLARWPQVQP